MLCDRFAKGERPPLVVGVVLDCHLLIVIMFCQSTVTNTLTVCLFVQVSTASPNTHV